jgi:Glycosyl transferase family 2
VARCRVFLFTYRRNHLLPRALDSLLAQTLPDWVCELHNDDPQDSFPRQLAERIQDPRISVVDHPRNLGATQSFNLVFRTTEEPFASQLEDDNWWEPEFLQVMIETLEQYPNVDVAWANMRVWQEGDGGSWFDTGRNFWDLPSEAAPKPFHFPDLARIGEAAHSNGAMLVRTRRSRDFIIPDNTFLGAMEAVRERAFPHPILLVPRRLANFSMTRQTARSSDGSLWLHGQLLLTASFLKNVPLDAGAMDTVWAQARTAPTRRTTDLVLAALFFPDARHALRSATPGDTLRCFASVGRHPLRTWRTFVRIQRDRELWTFLNAKTAERVDEAARRLSG